MPPADPEVALQLAALHIRAGSPPDLRQRDRALAWLLENAARAFPVALAAAETAPHDRVLLDLLGRCRRAEATPLLTRAFAVERTRSTAAAGLGMSPDPAARAVLFAALLSADPREVIAGLAGLGASGDRAACAEITPRVTAADAEVRWMAVEAGARLGCLDRAALERIAREDANADVRTLAGRHLQ